MQQLIQTLRQVMPAVIKEVNEVRIPALESAWGRSFAQEMQNENQVTVEIAKNYARPLNNCMFRHVNAILPDFLELTTDGSDYVYQGINIEDKNSFSPSAGWVGNGFKKTPLHLLKKFAVDNQGRITDQFVCLVDLSRCASGWSAKNIKTNRSVIQFALADQPHIEVIVGSLARGRTYLRPQLVPV